MTPHPRDSATKVITLDDLSKLLQSIREQDIVGADLPELESQYVRLVMTDYLRRMSCACLLVLF